MFSTRKTSERPSPTYNLSDAAATAAEAAEAAIEAAGAAEVAEVAAAAEAAGGGGSPLADGATEMPIPSPW
jgi:hypothetical protein